MRARPAASPPSGRHLILGELELFCQRPGEMEPARLDEIERLVLGGQAVAATYVRHNLERAHLIAYALDGGRVVGTVSLKHPRPEYLERLKRRTGLDLEGYLERGYTSVHPDYRGLGLGTRLVDFLTRQALERGIYVVIAMDNLGAQVITKRCGTELAARFRSQDSGREYGIWIQRPLTERPSWE